MKIKYAFTCAALAIFCANTALAQERTSRIERRVERLESKVDRRGASLQREINNKTAAINRKYDRQVSRLDNKIERKIRVAHERMDRNYDRIVKANKRIAATGAIALATSSLPTTLPSGDRFGVGMGSGHFAGDHAISFGGVARLTDKTTAGVNSFINVGGAKSFDTRYYGVRTGLTVTW